MTLREGVLIARCIQDDAVYEARVRAEIKRMRWLRWSECVCCMACAWLSQHVRDEVARRVARHRRQRDAAHDVLGEHVVVVVAVARAQRQHRPAGGPLHLPLAASSGVRLFRIACWWRPCLRSPPSSCSQRSGFVCEAGHLRGYMEGAWSVHAGACV